jgi:hypothetical protein
MFNLWKFGPTTISHYIFAYTEIAFVPFVSERPYIGGKVQTASSTSDWSRERRRRRDWCKQCQIEVEKWQWPLVSVSFQISAQKLFRLYPTWRINSVYQNVYLILSNHISRPLTCQWHSARLNYRSSSASKIDCIQFFGPIRTGAGPAVLEYWVRSRILTANTILRIHCPRTTGCTSQPSVIFRAIRGSSPKRDLCPSLFHRTRGS